MTDLTRLAIVVVTYSPGDQLRRFVSSLDRHYPGARLILSDNGSTDGVPQEVVAARPNTELLIDMSNPGYGAAVNAAARAAEGSLDWLLVCNPDVELAEGSIEALRAALENDSRAASAGPRIFNTDGSVYPSARQLPSFRVGIGHALFVNSWPGNPWTRRYLRSDVSQSDSIAESGWLSGACLLLRLRPFADIGGFDDDFFMYFEDVDLARRLGDAGWVNLFVPDAHVLHVGGVTANQHRKRTLRAHHESAYLYLRKKYPHVWLRPVLWAVRAALSIRLHTALRRASKSARQAPYPS
ncbi:glycosyltransferase family 2 protein [uncultured Schumannella sp.]|uniref:glycosyltransferase family 2 protein n=1 Tax=uncultured Schumannella sp. TaxID=1195956 RepID=UPI0025EF937D|nr:glycosyltransferase family 2 protein [uncultured Schumannella sp.]